jgi:hypothetical protein
VNTAIREPLTVARLPHDRHGRPVPWFVAWIDGRPDFRIVKPGATANAVTARRCWVCGTRFAEREPRAFVVGPMCVVNRNSAEPPSHTLCAVYSARACPFLATPQMTRRDRHLPDGTEYPPGDFIQRNPGVTAVWTARRGTWHPWSPEGSSGLLFYMGEPRRVAWYREGREATRDEIVASIDSGLPAIRAVAETEPGGLDDLERGYAAALELVPR